MPTTTKRATKPSRKAEFKDKIGESIVNTVEVYNQTALTAVSMAKTAKTLMEALENEIKDFAS